jgi:NADH-quinone oxidoreductase subunit N
MPAELLSALTLATPELLVAVGAMVLLMVGVYSGKNANALVTWLSVALLAIVFYLVWTSPDGSGFGGAYTNDAFARLMKMLTVGGSLVTLAMSVEFARREKFDMFEFPVLVLLATLGMMLMVSANNLLALYMGLELQSLALYVVAAIDRDNSKFRAWRLVIGHVAVWHLIGLWLYRPNWL